MKIRTVIPIMVISCILLASVGYAQKATITQDNLVTIDFIDTTGTTPVTKTVQMPCDQWTALQHDLREIQTSSLPAQDAFTAQVQVFKDYRLLPSSTSAQTVTSHFRSAAHRLALPLNNSNINAMCAVNFQLNGTTWVLGLNSFVNYIGFDIISFHKGTAINGIQSNGMLGSKTSPAGDYAGFMFGFLGYWVGERTQIGVYSSLTAAGFTVITAWVPVQ